MYGNTGDSTVTVPIVVAAPVSNVSVTRAWYPSAFRIMSVYVYTVSGYKLQWLNDVAVEVSKIGFPIEISEMTDMGTPPVFYNNTMNVSATEMPLNDSDNANQSYLG
jgi:hypothetical protein